MPTLPTGTVTMMFTDIAGSTALLKELGSDYPDALAEHRRVLRAIFERRNGIEVDTQGDAFFVVFERASDALAAAQDAQQELRGQVRVRIGVHTGEPLPTGDGYIGLDVHLAARISAAGHGGQVLVSQTTRELVGPDGLHDLGRHQLKDVGAVQLYQLGAGEFPQLKTVNRTNLPTQATHLVGRVTELEELISLLSTAGTRLVTLTGPGGMGKTSLAIAAAHVLLADFEQGAWLVDLAPLADAGLVESTIAAALGSPTDPREYLRDRQMLLVLDNFEQVVEAAAVVGEILEVCPGVSVLATSREPLRLRAEREFPLRELDAVAAASLFRERASAVLPSFEADPALMAELVWRLEGIPLAIELAAARVKLLNLDQIAERLDSRLSLLTGGARDLPERQRTLEATIAWSYALLDDRERELFARLAVFAGGWTLDAAEQVCDADLDTLQSLVDKSLVRSVDGRFTMLESIGEYALARLGESAGGGALEHRHALYYLALAERAEPELTGRNQHVWLERLAADYENLRAALEWCSENAEHVSEGLQLGSSLVLFWFIRGPYHEGVRWLEPLVAASAGDRTVVRAGALWGVGLMWTLIGDPERAETALEQCLELARELGDDSWAARALDVMGLLAFFANDPRCRELFEESIALARAAGDEWCLTDCLGTIGSIYPLQGEPQKAQSAGAEALELARRAGDQQGLRMALFGLGLAAYRRGDLSPARAYAEQGLAVARGLDDSWFTPYFLWVLATVETDAGRHELAEAAAGECLRLARELEAPMMLVCALDAAAACARCVSDDEAAIALLREAEAVSDGPVPWSYVSSALTALALVQAQSGDQNAAELTLQRLALARDDHAAAERDAIAALRLQLQLGDQIGAATSMDIIAFAAYGGGDVGRAARLCAASDAVRGRVGALDSPWAATPRAELVTRVKGSIGAARYDQLETDLAGVSLAEAVRTAG